MRSQALTATVLIPFRTTTPGLMLTMAIHGDLFSESYDPRLVSG
jgi:hypothetical protein